MSGVAKTPKTAPRRSAEDTDDAGMTSPQTAAKQLFTPPPPNATANALWGSWELWCDYPPHCGGLARRAPHRASEAIPDGAPGGSWIDTVKTVGVFDTAEGFWRLHHCLAELSLMPAGMNLYLLRRNIPPMWEHEANRRGGKWTAVFPLSMSHAADRVWLGLRLAAVGETLPGRDIDICGVTASRRRHGFRVAVWLRFANAEDLKLQVGEYLRGLVADPSVPVQFSEHCASLLQASRARSPLTPNWSNSRSLSPIERVESVRGGPPTPSLPASPTNRWGP